MERLFLYKIKIVATFLCALWGVQLANAQSIGKPILTFGNACVSAGFNTYTVSANYSGTFSGGNTFQLQLSDTDGNFPENPEIITTPTVNISGSSIEFEDFSFPLTVGSDTYRLRVFATDGNVEGQRSDLFGAYYYDGEVYRLEPRCLSGGGTFVAEPSDFDSYLWFKVEGNSTVLIPGETSNTLTVTEEGRYFFTREFGVCQSATTFPQSNFSDVVAAQGSQVSINETGPISVCSNEQVTFTTTLSPGVGSNFSWYKDDVLVEDITDPDFTVIGSTQAQTLTVTGLAMEGSYRFDVRSSLDDECSVQSEEVEIVLRNPKISIISETTVLLLPPGEPKTITAQIIRGTPPITITWFRIPPGGTTPEIVPGATTTSIQVTDPGTYYVQLTASSPCPEGNTVKSAEEVQVVPAENLTITIANPDPNYENCEESQTSLQVTEVTATVAGELVVLDQIALQSLQVDWQRDGVSTGDTGQTIFIDGASENGFYSAGIEGVFSSSIQIILGLDSFDIIKTPEELPIGGQIELSLGLENTLGYEFTWFRNLTEQIGSGPSIDVDQPGRYSVEVRFGSCPTPATAGPITITTGSPVIPSVITPNGDGINDDWVLPSDFTQLENVEVNVYASNGELDYSTVNYDGEWPQESKSKAVGTVYYYVINVDNSPVEQGSITIIR